VIYFLSALCIALYILGLPVMVCAFQSANKRDPDTAKEWWEIFMWPLYSLYALLKAMRRKS